ncbi:hypothetical protein EGT07_13395 [Herbaspirillum sp. HC18]|nr:hypothetical protein EGT07_13395 [Herbaspirillum sp. HC18]
MALSIPPGGSSVTFNVVAGGGDNFKNSLKGKSEEELRGMLKDPTLSAEDKKAILEELKTRAQAKAQSAQGTQEGADADELQKLLQKLEDGTISQQELQKLAGMLGMKPEDLEKLKGNGGSDTPPMAFNDIQ